MKTSLGATTAAEDSAILAADGVAPAQATVLIYGESANEAETPLITATAKGQFASATVQLAGPPRLSPETLDRKARQSQSESVIVTSDGQIDSCVATAANSTYTTATAGGVSVLGVPTKDSDGDGVVEITLTVREDLAASGSLQLRRCDSYDQCRSTEAVAVLGRERQRRLSTGGPSRSPLDRTTPGHVGPR